MFVFDVCVGCGVGEVGSAAAAGEISALGIFSFSPGIFLHVHFKVKIIQVTTSYLYIFVGRAGNSSKHEDGV